MRLGLLRAVYWVITYVASVLVPFNVPHPFGRAFLSGRAGPWKSALEGRTWAEAVAVSAIWWVVPWFCWHFVEEPLRNMGITMPWMDPDVGGSAYWWFVGAGLAFGLLHRSGLATIVAAALVFAWQWAILEGPVTELMMRSPLGGTASGAVVYGAVVGLVVAVVDLAAALVSGRPKGEDRASVSGHDTGAGLP